MPEHGGTAQPGRVSGALHGPGTLFAALYGDLVPHPWRDPESEHDAYQLFHQRSLAMGWLDEGATDEDRTIRPHGLWAMNDAGWEHPRAAAGTGLISWFQVEAGAVADDRPLPVQPFLRCAEETTARIGTPHLSAVQVLLPVQALDSRARPPYATVPALRTRHWFAERDPRSSTPVRVGVNSGRDPAISAVAGQLVEYLGRGDQDVFVCESHEFHESQEAHEAAFGGDVLPPPFDDGFWNGPPSHGAVLRGALAEWSCDAVGWLAEAVADSASQLGVRTPLLLTARASDRTLGAYGDG